MALGVFRGFGPARGPTHRGFLRAVIVDARTEEAFPVAPGNLRREWRSTGPTQTNSTESGRKVSWFFWSLGAPVAPHPFTRDVWVWIRGRHLQVPVQPSGHGEQVFDPGAVVVQEGAVGGTPRRRGSSGAFGSGASFIVLGAGRRHVAPRRLGDGLR